MVENHWSSISAKGRRIGSGRIIINNDQIQALGQALCITFNH